MAYECQVLDQPTQPTLSVRARTSVAELPRHLGSTYDAIARYLGEAGQHPAGPPFVAYYNMAMDDLDVEVGFPVASPLPGKGGIQPGELPAGKVATCLHVGPYQECGGAYTALTQFVQQHGLQPTGVAYEFYLNDPTETPPAQLQTRIVFPLR